jgi:hypothetical protein
LAEVTTAKEAARRLNLKHSDVIRRINRGDIDAQRLGWFWLVETEEIERVKEKPWYLALMRRRNKTTHA